MEEFNEVLKHNHLYRSLFGHLEMNDDWNKEVKEVKKTIYRGKASDNSLCFTNKTDKFQVCNILTEIFNANNEEFKKKFEQAISGDGNEENRISRLHSSSLLALLCFYKISEMNPLMLEKNGNKYKFTKSLFEVQNKINGGGNPSNIDVVLLGENCSNCCKVVLYLESKMTEYVKYCGKVDKISSIYSPIFKELNYEIGEKIKIKEQDSEYSLGVESGKCTHYCRGLKQFISHYCGIQSVLDNSKNYSENSKKLPDSDLVKLISSTSTEVLLAEIAFKIDDKNEKYEDYCKYIKSLAEKLNEINKKNQFKVIPDVLSYQDIFSKSDLINKKIKDFYNLK